MLNDTFNLNRFLEAQEHTYLIALTELKKGQKESHWIWYIFPQLKGLGSSQMSNTYGITTIDEARAYRAHPILGPRLIACVTAILSHRDSSAKSILGEVDALKFRSCLTLFSQAAPESQVFSFALHCFFGGVLDPKTVSILKTIGE